MFVNRKVDPQAILRIEGVSETQVLLGVQRNTVVGHRPLLAVHAANRLAFVRSVFRPGHFVLVVLEPLKRSGELVARDLGYLAFGGVVAEETERPPCFLGVEIRRGQRALACVLVHVDARVEIPLQPAECGREVLGSAFAGGLALAFQLPNARIPVLYLPEQLVPLSLESADRLLSFGDGAFRLLDGLALSPSLEDRLRTRTELERLSWIGAHPTETVEERFANLRCRS